MNDVGRVITFLAGLGAGIAIGILFAPDKGEYTREKSANSMKNLAQGFRKQAVDQIEHFNHMKSELTEAIKSKLKKEPWEIEGQTDEHAWI
ncbi:MULTISPECIES: YtxH domain-containing protein [Olivibacter]|jgi:gas vesicle protein|uniref:YtxH domain-containing protein n=2 Tax=Olivibacter TaxID=376469 RepID=A0ABV6HH23_9SPHI|nr:MULTISPECIES: YtxH domain-containing protein [Olivibacter]MCL4638586.1 YtxH domain-containing protein [Olivibacter sp. UJ_SKK_5.1]MDM8176827.1 YtxH domain-containing protein [Olivibacter sp. 47]MDX3912942.1 YtxH domain-containing protein [Pseudosphingobacterium sp.]QEL00635.1 YtxH domain-containing protein [Olivibacter sp. LS-1]